MTYEKNFFDCFEKGNFYYVIKEQSLEQNLKAFRNTMRTIVMNGDHIDACTKIAGNFLDEAVVTGNIYFMLEALQIVKERAQLKRETLESSTCFLLLEKSSLEKDEFENKTVAFENMINSYASQLKPTSDLRKKYDDRRPFNYDFN